MQVDFASNTGTVNHTSNRIIDQILLRSRIIREVSVLNPPMNPRIVTIEMAPQMLMTSSVQEILAYAASINVWISRTPRQISKTGVDGYTPISTSIHNGISKTSSLYYIYNSGTSILIEIVGTSTAPPAGYK